MDNEKNIIPNIILYDQEFCPRDGPFEVEYGQVMSFSRTSVRDVEPTKSINMYIYIYILKRITDNCGERPQYLGILCLDGFGGVYQQK